MSKTRSTPTVARYKGAKSKSVRIVILLMSDGLRPAPRRAAGLARQTLWGPPDVDLGKVGRTSRPRRTRPERKSDNRLPPISGRGKAGSRGRGRIERPGAEGQAGGKPAAGPEAGESAASPQRAAHRGQGG